MDRLVTLKNNNLIISFNYDPYIVEVVGHFGNRRFDNKNKVWVVPLSQLNNVVETLQPLHFKFDPILLEEQTKIAKKRQRLERVRNSAFKETELAKFAELNLPLFPFQRAGSGFLCAADNACNGDQPGLGKSIQSIAAAKLKNCKKVLVFTFATLKDTWLDEWTRWAPDYDAIVIRGEKSTRDKQWAQDKNVYIANYEQLLRDLQEIKKIKWDAIIADEATRISNPKSKTTVAIKKIDATYRWPLTGTPLSNSVQDIWSIIDFCEPGALGSYYQFTEKYCQKDRWGSIKGYKNLDILKEELKPFMIRRLKSNVLEQLPAKMYENIFIDLSQEERDMYKAVQKGIVEELKELGMTERRGLKNALTRMLRLKQATGSLELISDSNKSSKVEALKELLEIICVGDSKVVIFTFFKKMALILMRELSQYKPLLIAGGVSQEERTKNRDAFNTNDENKVMIMTEAGAFGLNLQKKAQNIVHYDLPWSVTKKEQREDRVHRIGQTGKVMVYTLLAKDSIDEYNLQVVKSKQRTSERVLGDEDTVKKVKISKALIQKMLK